MSQNESNAALAITHGELFDSLPPEDQIIILKKAVFDLAAAVELLADAQEVSGKDKAENLNTARKAALIVYGMVK